MRKRITGKTSNLPIGCILEKDLFTDTGVLLYPRMTIIDSEKLKAIENYTGFISTVVTIPEENPKPRLTEFKNEQFEFNESFQKYANESIQHIYANIKEPDKMVEQTEKLSKNICDLLMESKDIGINVAKLKVSDEYTYKHSVGVGTMTALIATSMQKDDQFIQNIAISGILHDIGKEAIPKTILNKPGKLTPEEFAIMKQHPVFGYQMLMQTTNLPEDIKQGILNHHENMDGTGYPRQLKGDEIGEMGKIITVVDVFDALVAERPYKKEKSPAEAMEIMFTMSNKFDLNIFRAFLDIVHIYPNGTKIRLSNNETATVIEQNKSYPLRPIVEIEQSKRIVDMSTDMDYLSVIIVK